VGVNRTLLLLLSVLLPLPAAAVCPQAPVATLTCGDSLSGQLASPWLGSTPALECDPGFNQLDSQLGSSTCAPILPPCLAWNCVTGPQYTCGTAAFGEGPEDVYAFLCPASGSVTLGLSGIDCDLDLYMLPSSCDPASCVFGSTNGGVDPEGGVTACSPGLIYYFVVEGFGFTEGGRSDGPTAYCNTDSASPQGNYTLSVDCIPDPVACDTDADGSECADDCDDTNPLTYPSATELPDGQDNDCDGIIDEGTDRYDDDFDGYTELGGDCDDADASRNPAAVEVCNSIDQDCDGVPDDGTSCADDDGDGFSEDAGDCNDSNPAVSPGATEVQGNGLDDDCDGTVDGSNPDPDGDGVAESAGDCAPDDFSVYPGANELPDGVDNDCDGLIDEGTTVYDDDGDGFTEDDGDCNDRDGSITPGIPELDNGVDDDCDGQIDEGTAAGDDDGDGFTENGGDCDDTDPSITPGATEIENGVDDDCDGQVDEGLLDRDRDGYSTDDCDDDDGFVNPGTQEVCDRIDNNCDGVVDEGCDEEDPEPLPEDPSGCAHARQSLGGLGLHGLLSLGRRR